MQRREIPRGLKVPRTYVESKRVRSCCSILLLVIHLTMMISKGYLSFDEACSVVRNMTNIVTIMNRTVNQKLSFRCLLLVYD